MKHETLHLLCFNTVQKHHVQGRPACRPSSVYCIWLTHRVPGLLAKYFVCKPSLLSWPLSAQLPRWDVSELFKTHSALYHSYPVSSQVLPAESCLYSPSLALRSTCGPMVYISTSESPIWWCHLLVENTEHGLMVQPPPVRDKSVHPEPIHCSADRMLLCLKRMLNG